MISENKAYTLSIFLTILMVFCTYISGYANENSDPVFIDGARAIRSIAENTPAGVNIGAPVAATDADGDTLTYSKGWLDGMAFTVDSATGQIQTKAALDYETQKLYSFAIFADDGNGGKSVTSVTINVTDVDETPANSAPVFTDGTSATRSIAENTASGTNIGTAIAATDADNDTLTYTLEGTDASSFSIVSTSGQLQTNAALDYEAKSSYSVRITVSDSKLTDTIDVTINVTDVDENRAPSFADGASTTRSVAENTGSGQDIGSAVAATDPDDDTLTYTLGGTDAASFRIDSTNGQLRTSGALDYETKSSYSVRITVSDSKLTDTIDVTINVTDVDENRAPSFTEGNRATRSVAENTGSGENIGSAVGATDPDTDDTLTYTLGGTDASSFSIVSTSGQLQTSTALNYESKSSYSVSVSVSDGNGGSDSIDVTINVTNVNEAPSFANSTATRSIAENTAANTNIGTAISATDPDTGDTLTYTLGGADAAAFRINSTNGRLKTRAALDYETKTSYTVTITVSDSELTDTIDVTINVTDVDENRAPSFTDGASTTRSVAENTAANTNIGSAVAATDPDDDTLTYTLGGTDAAAFSIVSTSGQLRTNAALNYESDASYSVRVSVSDGNGESDSIDVTINVTDVNETPIFANSTAARSIAENTGSGEDIGSAVSATDPDDDTLTYILGGTDAAMFSIVSTSGQLQTNAALDYEAKSSYSVRITVSDAKLTDTIDVTVNVTDVSENRAPAFTAGASTTRSVAENTAADTNIGSAISATDPDDDTLTYTLGGTDAASFSIVSTSGQLQTNAALDYETKTSYSVRITVSDSELTDTIDVTINVTDVDENRAPAFADGTSTTRSVAENTAADTNIGSAISATDPDDDTLTYTLGGTDAASFSIVSTSGQLQTNAALDYESKSSYSVTVDVSDGNGGSDSIPVTISVTDVNESPIFANSTAARSIAENTGSGEDIGAAITATDVDANTTLTYTLGGADAASFSIVSTSGQLQTNAALDYETKTTYSVRITVSDSELTDTIDVTINVTDVDENRAPAFADGTSTTRSVAENTAADTNIGSAVSATDPDTDDTLTYSLSGADAAAFSINSTTGQLQTSAVLDYETKTTYSVRITVSDSELTDTIDVTISVTNVNEAPSFATTTATRSIAENTAANTNIGAAITATDVDANTTLAYTLGGADASSFSIVSTSGQLQTNAALDHETKASYSVTVTAADGDNLSDTITVTITVTNVDEAPSFTEGSSATRSVAENTAADTNIGTVVAATDPDTRDTLTYTLGGTDAASFTINSTNGQLQTSTALDYETKTSYTVTITVSDSELTDTIDVTINVTNVNEAPSFTAGSTATRTIAENTASGTNIGTAVTATDVDANTTLTYTLGGTDAATFSIVSTSGQLQTSAALNYETKTSYSVKISVADGSGGTDTIDVTIDVTDVYEPIIHRTQQVQDAIVAKVPGVNHADYVTVAHLAAITELHLNSDRITSLKSGDFNELPALTHLYLQYNSISDISVLAGLTKLTTLNLFGNSISDISALAGLTALTTLELDNNSISNISALAGLTKLTELYLSGNSISNISALAGLTKLTTLDLSLNSISDISALAGLTALIDLDLSINSISNISALAGLTKLTELYLSDNSISDISALAGLTKLTWLTLSRNSISNISALEGLTKLTELYLESNPISDYGPLYRLLAAIAGIEGHPGLTFDINIPPLFTDGTGTTRAVAENTASGQDIGTAVAATDAEDDTLTYSLEGVDAASFSMDTATGQLQTKAALDYETKTSYSVTVSVSDGNGGTDTIAVTINVTDVNDGRPPSFTEGTSTTRSVPENTASGQDIGTAVAATDADNDTLTYSLGGTDADSFSIDTATGQLQTKAALDYETKTSYSVTVSVDDGNGGTDTIAVTINVTDVNEAPRTLVNQRTQQVQDAIVAAVPGVYNADDVTSVHLAAITRLDLNYQNITSLKSGDFSGLTALTELDLSGNSISNISALSGLTTLTYLHLGDNSISNISALSGMTKLTELYLWSNSISNISALRGLTKLTTLELSDNSISNVSALERLTTLTDLKLSDNSISDYNPLRRLLTAIDGIEGHPGLTLDINIPPVFTEGTRTTRSVAEYTPPIQDIGDPVSATDANKDSLSYTLEGTDADAFSINSSTGQLRTNAALNYQTKRSYSVTVSVDDGNDGTDTIAVTIYVTNVNEALITPVNQRTQQVQDAIVGKVSGVDNADDVTPAHLAAIIDLRLRSEGITSLKSGDFSGLSSLTQFHLSGNSISDISVLSGLTKLTELDLSNNAISDISALSGLTKLTTLYLGGNSIRDIAALERLTKLTYLLLGPNPISDYAPLRRLKKANPDIYISINIENNPPQFTEGDNTTRIVAEDAGFDTEIGEPISATDTDPSDTLTYRFAPEPFGTSDAELFIIGSSSGQLYTNAELDYEEQTFYTVIVDVSDGNDGMDRITVTINVRDIAGAAPSLETSTLIPNQTGLLTNFPNPFNPETWIPYQLAKPAEVTLTIYDIRGVVVRELKLGHQPAGFYHNRSRAIHWDGRNAFGEKVATGVYFYTLKAGDFTATRKLLIRK